MVALRVVISPDRAFAFGIDHRYHRAVEMAEHKPSVLVFRVSVIVVHKAGPSKHADNVAKVETMILDNFTSLAFVPFEFHGREPLDPMPIQSNSMV